MAEAKKRELLSLQKVINKLEKQFGSNVIRKASDIKAEMMLRVPTGIIPLDLQIGGGLPVGRFIQIAGAFSSTKSSTAYHAIKEFQKIKMVVDGKKVPIQAALIQGENGSFTKEYAEQIGIDTDALIISESGGMEESLEVAYQLQLNGIAQLIVFDSFASLVPTKERESGMDEVVQMGLKPKLFDEYCRKFQSANNILSREGKFLCTVIGINQLREKIGQMHGNPEFTPGGRALGFTSALDIYLRRGEWITVGTGGNKAIIGQQVKFKINKSKVSVPFRNGDWEFYFDEGGPVPMGHVDNFKAIVLESIAYSVINQGGGGNYSFEEFKIRGLDALVDHLRTDEELFNRIHEKLKKVAEESHDEEFADIQENSPELLEYAEGVDAEDLKKAEELLAKTVAEEEAKKKTPAKKAPAKKAPAKKAPAKKTTNSRKKATK